MIYGLELKKQSQAYRIDLFIQRLKLFLMNVFRIKDISKLGINFCVLEAIIKLWKTYELL